MYAAFGLFYDGCGRVLLVRKGTEPLSWWIPGGKSLSGETPLKTLQRELEEELPGALRCFFFSPKPFLRSRKRLVRRARIPCAFFFRGKIVSPENIIPDGEEIVEARFFTRREVRRLPLPTEVLRRLLLASFA